MPIVADEIENHSLPSDEQKRLVKSQEFEIKPNANNPNINQSDEPVMNNLVLSDVGRQLGDLQLDADLELPESVRDLDLNRDGFEEEALKLPIKEFSAVIKSDDLKCKSEDHVLDLTLQYIEKAQNEIYD